MDKTIVHMVPRSSKRPVLAALGSPESKTHLYKPYLLYKPFLLFQPYLLYKPFQPFLLSLLFLLPPPAMQGCSNNAVPLTNQGSLSKTQVPKEQRIFNNETYELDTLFQQHGNRYKVWLKKGNGLGQLILQKSNQAKDTTIWEGNAKENSYGIADRNNDGYNDFYVLTARYYDLVYLFNPQTNGLYATPFAFPSDYTLLDSATNVYCGYSQGMCNEMHDNSRLYSFLKGDSFPSLHYELEYYSRGEQLSREHVTAIKLYGFRNGDIDIQERFFIQDIKTATPGTFDAVGYWKKNYRQLIKDEKNTHSIK